MRQGRPEDQDMVSRNRLSKLSAGDEHDTSVLNDACKAWHLTHQHLSHPLQSVLLGQIVNPWNTTSRSSHLHAV